MPGDIAPGGLGGSGVAPGVSGGSQGGHNPGHSKGGGREQPHFGLFRENLGDSSGIWGNLGGPGGVAGARPFWGNLRRFREQHKGNIWGNFGAIRDILGLSTAAVFWGNSGYFWGNSGSFGAVRERSNSGKFWGF